MKKTFTLLLSLFCITSTLFAEEKKQKQSMSEQPKVKMVTSLGDIEITLNAEEAPITVKNFLGYVEDGFYSGTIFHRVISNFMIQGGGFTSGLNQKATKAPIKLEVQTGLKNDRGTIAMARTGDPNSATCQFFINVTDNAMLNARSSSDGYAVFGKVTDGMEIVDKIRKVSTGNSKGHGDVPNEEITIESVELIK